MSNQTNLSAGSIYIVTERNCLCFCFETIYLFFFLSFFDIDTKSELKFTHNNDKISWTCVAKLVKTMPAHDQAPYITKTSSNIILTQPQILQAPHRKCSDCIISSNTGNYQGTSVFSLPPEGFEWNIFKLMLLIDGYCETAIRWMLLELADDK